MPARKSTRSSRKRRPAAKSRRVASRLAKATPAQAEAAKRKFEDGVVKRGEAVPEGEPLTRGATHTIVGTDAQGRPILKRKRFSLS